MKMKMRSDRSLSYSRIKKKYIYMEPETSLSCSEYPSTGRPPREDYEDNCLI
jgi:hypothetical protein